MTTLVTRAQWGAAPPVNVSHNVNPTGGAVIHHVGVGSYAYTDHARCVALVKAIQRMHMANTTENYVDIAYNLLACHHDYIFEGRSTTSDPKVRPGSNGTAQANTVALSICCLWGDGDGTPSQGILNAAAGGVVWLREKARIGTRVSGHRDWSSTSCPGYLYPKLGAIKALADNPPKPTPPPIDDAPEPAPAQETAVPIMVKGNKKPDVFSLDPVTGAVRHIAYPEYQVRVAAGETLLTVDQAVADQLAP